MLSENIKLWLQNVYGWLVANWLTVIVSFACLVGAILLVEKFADWYPSWAFWSNRQVHIEKADEAEREAEIFKRRAEHALQRESVLANQNALLKSQNEKQAEALRRAGDTETRRAGENIERIGKDFGKRLIEIEKTKDEDQICALCSEAKEQGIKFAFCEVCEK